MNKGESSGQRLNEWVYWLAEFNFDIIHVPGTEMAIADGLSRISGPGVADPTPDDEEEFPLANFSVSASAAPVNPEDLSNTTPAKH